MKELTPELKKHVEDFATIHGRYWKSVMRNMWWSNMDEKHPWIRQLRNNYGPTWLKNYRLEK